MRLRTILHPQAENELEEAARFYEEKGEGLGKAFLNAFRQTAQYIEQYPETSRIVIADIRCKHIAQFPYSLFFRVTPEHIRVLAVAHFRRQPNYWMPR